MKDKKEIITDKFVKEIIERIKELGKLNEQNEEVIKRAKKLFF